MQNSLFSLVDKIQHLSTIFWPFCSPAIENNTEKLLINTVHLSGGRNVLSTGHNKTANPEKTTNLCRLPFKVKSIRQCFSVSLSSCHLYTSKLRKGFCMNITFKMNHGNIHLSVRHFQKFISVSVWELRVRRRTTQDFNSRRGGEQQNILLDNRRNWIWILVKHCSSSQPESSPFSMCFCNVVLGVWLTSSRWFLRHEIKKV